MGHWRSRSTEISQIDSDFTYSRSIQQFMHGRILVDDARCRVFDAPKTKFLLNGGKGRRPCEQPCLPVVLFCIFFSPLAWDGSSWTSLLKEKSNLNKELPARLKHQWPNIWAPVMLPWILQCLLYQDVCSFWYLVRSKHNQPRRQPCLGHATQQSLLGKLMVFVANPSRSQTWKNHGQTWEFSSCPSVVATLAGGDSTVDLYLVITPVFKRQFRTTTVFIATMLYRREMMRSPTPRMRM